MAKTDFKYIWKGTQLLS